MNMKTLKFDNTYLKFPVYMQSGDKVRLLEVFNTRFEDLHSDFVMYDSTSYNCGNYRLPKIGDALVLLLLLNSELFTSIRKYTNKNEYEYRALRGQYLIVEIKN